MTSAAVMQGAFKNDPDRGGDGLVPKDARAAQKPRGRGRLCPFLERAQRAVITSEFSG
jgi:hypothetical protein